MILLQEQDIAKLKKKSKERNQENYIAVRISAQIREIKWNQEKYINERVKYAISRQSKFLLDKIATILQREKSFLNRIFG